MTQTLEAQLFSRWIVYLESHDIEGLLSQYHDHAVIINVDHVVDGKPHIRRFYQNAELLYKGLSLDRIERYTRIADVLVVQSIFLSEQQAQRVCGVMILRDGKILYHIITLIEQR
jgi:ketosteroid isomerase-like protein